MKIYPNKLCHSIEEQLEALQKQIASEAPAHTQKVGKLLRKRSVFFFGRYLKKLGINLKKGEVPLFMDYLTLKRIDLKDLWEESRERLRVHMLKNEPNTNKTEDYLMYVEGRDSYTCKHCKWFVEIPPDEDKTCVALGAKGPDKPCYGFSLKPPSS